MHKSEFTSNPNGKLFMDHFNDVRLYDEQRHVVGVEEEVWLRNHYMGIISIQVVLPFKFQQIRDVLGFTIYGKPAHYLAAMLKKFYPKETTDENINDAVFVHMVKHWKKRNMPVQDKLIADWWKEQQEAHVYEQTIQGELAL
jgi:hypothetical protein